MYAMMCKYSCACVARCGQCSENPRGASGTGCRFRFFADALRFPVLSVSPFPVRFPVPTVQTGSGLNRLGRLELGRSRRVTHMGLNPNGVVHGVTHDRG